MYKRQVLDHAELQAAVGRSVGNTIVQSHEIHRPAADVHEKDRRLILDEFGGKSDGGVPLREQFHILDGDFVGDSFEFEAHQLGRTQEVFPERFLFPAKASPAAMFTEHSVITLRCLVSLAMAPRVRR